jgi:two-component system, LuxR family, sensor kinase FixL
MGAHSEFDDSDVRGSISWVRLAILWILLAIVYFGSGKLGLVLAIVHSHISAVWPATGVALAALLVFGYRAWPAIFCGAFLVNITAAGDAGFLACLGIAIGNTLEGLIGAILVNRFAHGIHAFERPRDVFRFTLFAALGGTMVSATCGVLCLAPAKDKLLLNWGTWWLGDAIGALVIAPPLILWSVQPRLGWDRRKLIQAAGVLLGLVGISTVVFGDTLVPQERSYPLAFACLPLIIWVAFVFGPREMATVTLLLAALAVSGTQLEAAKLVVNTSDGSLRLSIQVLLQTFLGITSVTGLTLASVIAERNRGEADLREAHAQLESRVKQRTTDLAFINEALNRENDERHTVEQALRSSQESLSLVIETAYDAYVAMDSAGLITDWNAQAEKTFGWLRQQVVGRSLTELIIPLRHRAEKQGLQKYLESGENSSLNQRIEFTALHRDGHEFPVELTFWMTPTPESVRFNAFIHDITERKRAEKKFRDLLESAPDAMVIVNDRGEIVLINAQTERLFGYGRKELLGKFVELLVPAGLTARHQQHRRKYFKDPGVRPMGVGMQLHGRHKDGHEFPVEISLSPLVTDEGVLVSSAIRDITTRQETEDKLRQAERLAAIGEMITGLAHESRNALQQSQACLELLALKLRTMPDVSSLVEDIQKSQDHLHHLFEEVRGYAAPIKLRRETIDLGQIIDDTWNQLALMRQGRHAELLAHADGINLACSVDRLAIQQVFRNILENALQACPDPVEIRVTWSETDLRGQPGLCVALRDNGPGISPEARKKLFQPFFTTKIQGTGLGLAISRRIVEAHQGSIAIGTKPPGGTEILICLPRK